MQSAMLTSRGKCAVQRPTARWQTSCGSLAALPAPASRSGTQVTLHSQVPAVQLRSASSQRRSTKLQASSTAFAESPSADTYKPSNDDLKAALLDSLFGTERGLVASSELRAEINELITQLEAGCPTPAPNEVGDLNGEWKLVYTSNSELTALLALSKLPFVCVGDITQTIDGPSLTVTNKVQLTVPFSRTAFSSRASFEVRSPKLLNIKFEQGTIQTPELLQDIEIPESVTVLGQSLDLTAVRAALQPVTSSLRTVVAEAAKFVSQQPDLSFPIASDKAQSWLLTTYLDEDTRIARGDGGSVFVMVKEVSFSSSTPDSSSNGRTKATVTTTDTGSAKVAAKPAAPSPSSGYRRGSGAGDKPAYDPDYPRGRPVR